MYSIVLKIQNILIFFHRSISYWSIFNVVNECIWDRTGYLATGQNQIPDFASLCIAYVSFRFHVLCNWSCKLMYLIPLSPLSHCTHCLKPLDISFMAVWTRLAGQSVWWRDLLLVDCMYTVRLNIKELCLLVVIGLNRERWIRLFGRRTNFLIGRSLELY